MTSCYYDKQDAIYPIKAYANPCDSASTYNQAVKIIMANNCTSCHSTSSSFGNVILDNYNDVVKNAKNGNLMGSIQSQPGHTAMPPGGVKVTSCQIDKLNQWINAQEPQ
jgi:cytochrome c5